MSKNEKTVTQTEAKATPKFSVEQLGKNAYQLFGVTQSTYAGATFGLNADDVFTVQEMKDHIDKWLKKEVK